MSSRVPRLRRWSGADDMDESPRSTASTTDSSTTSTRQASHTTATASPGSALKSVHVRSSSCTTRTASAVTVAVSAKHQRRYSAAVTETSLHQHRASSRLRTAALLSIFAAARVADAAVVVRPRLTPAHRTTAQPALNAGIRQLELQHVSSAGGGSGGINLGAEWTFVNDARPQFISPWAANAHGTATWSATLASFVLPPHARRGIALQLFLPCMYTQAPISAALQLCHNVTRIVTSPSSQTSATTDTMAMSHSSATASSGSTSAAVSSVTMAQCMTLPAAAHMFTNAMSLNEILTVGAALNTDGATVAALQAQVYTSDVGSYVQQLTADTTNRVCVYNAQVMPSSQAQAGAVDPTASIFLVPGSTYSLVLNASNANGNRLALLPWPPAAVRVDAIPWTLAPFTLPPPPDAATASWDDYVALEYSLSGNLNADATAGSVSDVDYFYALSVYSTAAATRVPMSSFITVVIGAAAAGFVCLLLTLALLRTCHNSRHKSIPPLRSEGNGSSTPARVSVIQPQTRMYGGGSNARVGATTTNAGARPSNGSNSQPHHATTSSALPLLVAPIDRPLPHAASEAAIIRPRTLPPINTASYGRGGNSISYPVIIPVVPHPGALVDTDPADVRTPVSTAVSVISPGPRSPQMPNGPQRVTNVRTGRSVVPMQAGAPLAARGSTPSNALPIRNYTGVAV